MFSLQLFQHKKEKIEGNFKGDGLQNGGTVIINSSASKIKSYLVSSSQLAPDRNCDRFKFVLTSTMQRTIHCFHDDNVHPRLLHVLQPVVCSSEGEVLLRFIQEDPSDHVSVEEVLRALGIQSSSEGAASAEASGAGNQPAVVCDDNVCRIEK